MPAPKPIPNRQVFRAQLKELVERYRMYGTNLAELVEEMEFEITGLEIDILDKQRRAALKKGGD